MIDCLSARRVYTHMQTGWGWGGGACVRVYMPLMDVVVAGVI